MSLFTVNELKSRTFFEKLAFSDFSMRSKQPEQILLEQAKSFSNLKTYHIFLSHSFGDADMILELKLRLENLGFSVYVDWIEDRQLDRSKVSKETANLLRERMNCCQSLFYACTDNSVNSKWMPWECGYFDAKKDKVAILPISNSLTEPYLGQEYLGVYPYVTKDKIKDANSEILWINEDSSTYVTYDNWLKGMKPTKR